MQIKDFFISYNAADAEWAEWIAWQLETAKYSTIIQAWDFRPGSNFVLEMSKASDMAHRTIAVLSPDYLAAEFPSAEWAVAFARDSKSDKRLLVPVRVRGCNLTGLLRQIVYIDLVGLTEEQAHRALLSGIGANRQFPDSAPGFPGCEGAVPKPAFPIAVASESHDRSHVIGSSPRMHLLITINMDMDHFDETRRRWLQHALASFVSVGPDDVRIEAVSKGSVRVTISLPEDAAEALARAFFTRDPDLAKSVKPFAILDIQRVAVPDEELIRTVLSGNHGAYSRLVQRYQRPVFSLCYRMLGNPADAEDVTQEVFVVAYFALGSYSAPQPFAKWLLTIAARKCIDSQRLRRGVPSSLETLTPSWWRPDDAVDPEKQLELASENSQLAELLMGLSDDLRLVLVLRYWHDLDTTEIAEMLDISLSAVKLRLHRARRALAARLPGAAEETGRSGDVTPGVETRGLPGPLLKSLKGF